MHYIYSFIYLKKCSYFIFLKFLLLKIEDICRLRMMTLYFNLVQGNIWPLINVFLPHLTMGTNLYALRNRNYLLSGVRHEFAKRCYTFNLINTINKTSTLIKDIYTHLLQGYTTYINNSLWIVTTMIPQYW